MGFFHFYFLNGDISITINALEIIFSVCIHEVLLEESGSMCQIFNLGPSYVKGRVTFCHFKKIKFLYFQFLHSIKAISTKTYIKTLRHPSLHSDIMNAYSKFEQNV